LFNEPAASSTRLHAYSVLGVPPVFDYGGLVVVGAGIIVEPGVCFQLRYFIVQTQESFACHLFR
jgi:hypothetical protein